MVVSEIVVKENCALAGVYSFASHECGHCASLVIDCMPRQFALICWEPSQ